MSRGKIANNLKFEVKYDDVQIDEDLHDKLQSKLEAWVSKHRGKPWKDIHDITNWSMMTAPKCRDFDKLHHYNCQSTLLTMLDDYYAQPDTKHDLVKVAVNCGTPQTNHWWERCYESWFEMMKSSVTPTQMERFIKFTYSFICSEDALGEITSSDLPMTWDLFWKIRGLGNSIAFAECFPIVEFCYGLNESSEALKDPLVIEFEALACMHSAVINDLVSWGKEVVAENTKTNGITIIMAESHCDLQTAAEKLVEKIYETETKMENLKMKILANEKSLISREYLDMLLEMCNGSKLYQLFSPRYLSELVNDNVLQG